MCLKKDNILLAPIFVLVANLKFQCHFWTFWSNSGSTCFQYRVFGGRGLKKIGEREKKEFLYPGGYTLYLQGGTS